MTIKEKMEKYERDIESVLFWVNVALILNAIRVIIW